MTQNNVGNDSRAATPGPTAGDGVFGAVDIGGTKLHAVIARADGTVLGRARKKTKPELGFTGICDRVGVCLREACEAAGVEVRDLAAVGVGAPSPVRPDGTAAHAPNLGWHEVPLAGRLTQVIGRPVFAENDCNLGTLGEYAFGAMRGVRSLCGLFVGTGLGGGIVQDGKMVRGHHHLAAEVGHMIVKAKGRRCGCGHRGCLEAYASKTGLGRRLRREIFKRGRASLLTKDLPAPDVDKAGKKYGKGAAPPAKSAVRLGELGSSVLAQAYRDNDLVLHEAMDELCWYLGTGVANILTLLGPEAVILGGGVFEALGQELLEPVRAAAAEQMFPAGAYDVNSIQLATLGDDTVALGALAWVVAGAG